MILQCIKYQSYQFRVPRTHHLICRYICSVRRSIVQCTARLANTFTIYWAAEKLPDWLPQPCQGLPPSQTGPLDREKIPGVKEDALVDLSVHLGNVGRYVFAPVSCHRLVVLLRRYQCTKFTSEVLPQFVLGSQCTNLWILFCPHFFSGTVRRSGEQPKHLFTMNPISSTHSTRF